MARVSRGLRLLGVSWGVVRQTPALAGVAAFGVAGHLAIWGGMSYWLFHGLPDYDDFRWPRTLVVIPLISLGQYVSVFCNAVVVSVAHGRLQGRPVTTADGIRHALARLPRLLAWTTLSIVVGTVLHVIAERLAIAGRVASWLLGLAWGLATAFAIPVLVIEGRPLRRALPRSAGLFRQRWGETVTANVGLGLIAFFAGLALCPVVGLVALVSVEVAVVAGLVALAVIVVAVGTLEAVLDTALYEYAATGRVLGFAERDLRQSFQPD